MARSTQPPLPKSANLTIEQMRRGIERLRKRIDDVEAFDPAEVPSRFHSSVEALDTAIADTLDRVFGIDTMERRRSPAPSRISALIKCCLEFERRQVTMVAGLVGRALTFRKRAAIFVHRSSHWRPRGKATFVSDVNANSPFRVRRP